MKRKASASRGTQDRAIDALLEQILTDAYGDDEQLGALREAFQDAGLPTDGLVIGEPVSVVQIDYDGNERRGLTARCRREDGSEHVVAACDVSFRDGTEASRLVAAYRKWLGLDPAPAPESTPRSPRRRPKHHKATQDDVDLDRPVELAVLAPKEQAARCRIVGTTREITLRSRDVWDMVPGEIVTVRPRKQWRYAGHPYLSGEVESQRLDVAALDLVPLRLQEKGRWDPEKAYWREPDQPLEDWERAIIARGPRPSFEMEQVLPGTDPDDWDCDPIVDASSLSQAGDWAAAEKILTDLLAADLRCLDAHAHLGNFAFDRLPEQALRHYRAGVGIGELSLGEGFEGLLPWGYIDNRPMLRCLHGLGLCLWQLGRSEEATAVLERLLWLNPSDAQGARFVIRKVRAGEPFEEED